MKKIILNIKLFVKVAIIKTEEKTPQSKKNCYYTPTTKNR